MVQEYIPGGDDDLYTLGSYLAGRRRGARASSPAASCARPASTWASAAWPRRSGCPRSPSTACALLRALEFRGISQVEFKLDPRTGAYKLIEVNPRLWQWHGLATACGVDLTHIAYLDLVGRPPAPRRMTNEGRRWAITFMAGARHAVQRPPYTDALLARDDPRPALVQLGRVARGGVRRARRRAAASMAVSRITRQVERHG